MVSSMIPNIGGNKAEETAAFPTYEDMMMDPASALERVTGIYEEEIDKETAFQEILSRIYQKGYQSGQGKRIISWWSPVLRQAAVDLPL